VSAHVSERISAYIDRELPASERAVVDAHLRDCAECARAVQEMRAVDALARDHEVPAPAGYFDALPSRLRARLVPRARTRVPAWAVALAAGLAVAVLAPLALRQSPTPLPPAREAASSAALPAPASPEAPRVTPPTAAAPPAPATQGGIAPQRAGEETVRRERAAAAAGPRALRKSAAEPARADAPTAGFATQPTEATSAEDARGAAGANQVAPPPAAPAAAAEAEALDPEEEEDATPLVSDDSAPPRKAADTVAGAAPPRSAAPPAPGAQERLRSLSSRTMRSAAEARALRDAWQTFVREDPEGAHADVARLRALEAGAAAWRLGGQRDDRAQVEKDAREYLRRPDGAHKERVRALLAGLEP
jgi:hypothetical protein